MITLFSDTARSRLDVPDKMLDLVLLLEVVDMKVFLWTRPSVLIRMWLVLVTAYIRLMVSHLASSSSNFDKHCRACNIRN